MTTPAAILLAAALPSLSLAADSARSQTPAPPSLTMNAPPAGVTVTIKDLTPRFLDFYDAATRENAAPDRRWALWKEKYDFAAVPPTPEGDRIARALLDAAWPRYPGVLDRIRAGAAGLTPNPEEVARDIANLLRPAGPVRARLLVYVGGLEPNAFTTAQDGKVTTAIPVEMDPAARAMIMTHELTHAVHIGMGSFAGGWRRTIGTTILTEGLACRVTQALFPGHPEADSIAARPGWLAEASARRDEILRGIRPFLDSDTSEDVMRFTMGTGATGLEREAYYAGWLVVGHWLEHGRTFAEIARIPEKEMPREVGAALDALLTR